MIAATRSELISDSLKLLIWVGGVVTTIAGSWIASKIHVYHDNRKAHRNELNEKVLGPLLSCLEDQFAPLLTRRRPAVTAEWTAVSFAVSAPSTEAQTKFDLVLEAENPWRKFKAAVDRALYQDAKTTHLPDLLNRAEEFASAWEGYAAQVLEWIQEMSYQLSTATDIPPMKGGTATGPFVDSGFLGSFLYARLCQIPVGTLSKRPSGGDLWELHCSNTNVAMAPPDKLNLLTNRVDALIASQEQKGELFISRTEELAKELDDLEGEVRLVLANSRLQKRCNLVSFF